MSIRQTLALLAGLAALKALPAAGEEYPSKRNCSTPNEFARAWREGPPAWARPSVHDEARS